MNTFRRFLTQTAIAASLLTTSSLALAAEDGMSASSASSPQPSAEHMHHMAKERRDNLEKTLNLTADQKQKFQALRDKYRPQAQVNHNKLIAAVKKFENAFASNASNSDIKDTWEEVADVRTDMSEQRSKWMMEARDILTPEQRRRFVRYVAASERIEDFVLGGPGVMPPPAGKTDNMPSQ